MKQGLSEIVCIIDQSGSMGYVREDAIGGFNTFLEDQQKEPGEATLSLVFFNTRVTVVEENKPIGEIKNLTTADYIPAGGTALLDAVGMFIDKVGERLAATPEENRPEKVIFAILTDGEENSSRKYTREQVFEKIKHQREVYSWEFIFLAANQDAIQAGTSLGISAKDSLSFVSDKLGTRSAYVTMSDYTKGYRAKAPDLQPPPTPSKKRSKSKGN